MRALEKRLLIEFCRKHNIDPQEIDDSLTYWENKKHLQRLAFNGEGEISENLARTYMELERKYISENFLRYYVYMYCGERCFKPFNTNLPENSVLRIYAQEMENYLNTKKQNVNCKLGDPHEEKMDVCSIA